MTIEFRPVGLACNLKCKYCYQNVQRGVSNIKLKKSLDYPLKQATKYNQPIAFFGGEALLLPLDKLEPILKHGFETFGRSSIQTNGTLITNKHIKVFQQYNVSVGISMDGPGELNDARWVGNLAKTRRYTRRSETAVKMLIDAGIIPSLIITLHKLNAAPHRLPRLVKWILDLDSLGVKTVRLHNLEIEDPSVAEELMLEEDDYLAAFTDLYFLQKDLSNIEFDIYRDIRSLLLCDDRRVSCVWKACDPYTTPAVQGIEVDGYLSNCDRTNKWGVSFVKSDQERHERYLALYHTPQHQGGCGDCRFFIFCKGQCPGTAIDNDWRNRSADCRLWKKLFSLIEEELIESMQTPLSISSVRSTVEAVLVESWINAINMPLEFALNIAKACRNKSIQAYSGLTLPNAGNS